MFKKSLFAMLVAVYVITAIGVPVYFHYCGGTLEDVNYVTRGTSCCDGEEDDTMANDCCRDENIVLLSLTDFTIKDQNQLPAIGFVHLFTNTFSLQMVPMLVIEASKPSFAPPKRLHSLVITTAVLRV